MNDIQLTEINLCLKSELSSLDAYLRDGLLDAAFLRAYTLRKRADQLMDRLNELKYAQPLPRENPVAAEVE